MIPVARACVAVGHEVAVAAPASFAEHVRDAGFAYLPFPDAPPKQMAAISLGRLLESFADVLDEPLRELEALAGIGAGLGSGLIPTTPILSSVPASPDGPNDELDQQRV